MYRYVLIRILLAIPTVFIIAVCAFLLQSYTPGDTIADRLSLEGNSVYSDRGDYLQAYRELQGQMGLDKPKFYFGMIPSYFPDTLHRVVPKQKQVLLTNLLRQTKDWTSIQTFNTLILSSQHELGKDKVKHKELLSVVNKIPAEKDLSGIILRTSELAQSLSSLGSDGVPQTSALLNHMNQLKTTRAFSWPTVRWFGGDNQFHYWCKRLVGGKNISTVDGIAVSEKVKRAISWTVTLGLISFLLVAIISLLLSYLQVYFKDGWFDKGLSFIFYLLIAMPTFWLATLMVVFFTTAEYGQWTDIFPSVGIKPSFIEQSFLQEMAANFSQLILPIFCLTIMSVAYLTIQTKSDFLRVITAPFVRSSKSRGLSRAQVIFNIPGVGRLLLYSIRQEDWAVVFSVVIIMSIVTILGYLVGDILLAWFYPKTRQSLTKINTTV